MEILEFIQRNLPDRDSKTRLENFLSLLKVRIKKGEFNHSRPRCPECGERENTKILNSFPAREIKKCLNCGTKFKVHVLKTTVGEIKDH